jgi:hypothetical protein
MKDMAMPFAQFSVFYIRKYSTTIWIIFILVAIGAYVKRARLRREHRIKTNTVNLNGEQRVTYRELREG